jgi:hypothetical protein
VINLSSLIKLGDLHLLAGDFFHIRIFYPKITLIQRLFA